MSSADQPVAPEREGRRSISRARITFRWCRIALLGTILFGVFVLLWCNYVGVPASIANLVKAQLRHQNLNVEFSRLKLQGISHFIAQDLRFASTSTNESPRLEAGQAEVLIDFGRIRTGEIDVTGLRLDQGRLLLPIHATNQSPRYLVVSNIVSEVELLPGDVVRVTRASAQAFGAKAEMGGLLQNFSHFSRKPTKPGDPDSFQNLKRQLRDLAEILESAEFSEPPAISVHIFGDALAPADWRGNISITAGTARSRWGSFQRLHATSSVYPMRSNNAVAGTFYLRGEQISSSWGASDAIELQAETFWNKQMDQLLTNHVSFEIANVRSGWGAAESITGSLNTEAASPAQKLVSILNVQASALRREGYEFGASEFKANLEHALPFPTPAAWFGQVVYGTDFLSGYGEIKGDWSLGSRGIRLQNSTFQTVVLSGSVASPNLQTESLSGLFHSVGLSWDLMVSNVLSGDLDIGRVSARGGWASPSLKLEDLDVRLYGGSLRGTALLNFESRTGEASLEGDFDYQKTARFLDRPVQKWLGQFSWDQPPHVRADLAFKLPDLTNSWEAIEREITSTVGISGGLRGSGAFLGIPVDKAEGPFHYTNFTWRLPEFLVARPEGVSIFDYTGNVANGDFSTRVEMRFDPAAFRSLVPEEGTIAFNIVQFPEPVSIVGEAAGNWDRREEITFKGRFAASNFIARGIPVGDVAGEMFYSNLVLEAWNVSAHLGTGFVRAPYLRFDFPTETLWVTNVASTANPYDAMHIVGPDAYEAIDPYRFAVPPAVTVNGIVPLRDVRKADLKFEVAGQEFTFWRFRLPYLSGDVHWRGHELWITNVNASFYKGRATWEGYFLIHDEEDDSRDNADYRFTSEAADADLKLLVADVFGMTNQMEGRLTGSLVITSANTENDQSWNGYGQASLRDGFLWSVPVFGIFTPILDALVPGESMSRVTSGAGNFSITNSIVHTRDLQVRTRAFRLNYKGSVDLVGNLEALVEAEIFRDIWVLGRAFSTILWPVSKAFEARISGTATAPETKLRYFPRFLFAPFRAISDLGKNSEKPRTTPLPAIEGNPGPAGLGPGDPRPPSP